MPPAAVEQDGFTVPFASLTREQRHALGYTEALPLKRAPFTRYDTSWVTGDDLICRETALSATVDEAARDQAAANEVRQRRDALLQASDWSQLEDSPLDHTARTAWAAYRQALRDVPQQAGFPGAVEWPATMG
jgi:hypothetical protein